MLTSDRNQPLLTQQAQTQYHLSKKLKKKQATMKKLVRLPTKLCSSCFRIGKTRPPLQSNPAYNSIHKAYPETGELCVKPVAEEGDSTKICQGENKGNRIMIVVDSTKEAEDALQWALTHAVQKLDSLILLHVTNPAKKGKAKFSKKPMNAEVNPRDDGLLYSMKSVCQTKKPEIEVELVVVEGKEKGRLIVEEAKLQKVTLLVLGHKRRSLMCRLMKRWRRNQKSNAVAEYCIQNANCMAIAVRRKSRKAGGYLVTTKRHKNFWLLA